MDAVDPLEQWRVLAFRHSIVTGPMGSGRSTLVRALVALRTAGARASGREAEVLFVAGNDTGLRGWKVPVPETTLGPGQAPYRMLILQDAHRLPSDVQQEICELLAIEALSVYLMSSELSVALSTLPAQLLMTRTNGNATTVLAAAFHDGERQRGSFLVLSGQEAYGLSLPVTALARLSIPADPLSDLRDGMGSWQRVT